MINSTTMWEAVGSPARKIIAKVEAYNNSTLVDTYTYDSNLMNISIDRGGDSCRFFGFGVLQKLTFQILDPNREKDINPNYSFKVYFGTDGEETYMTSYPTFYILDANDITRNEINNQLTITAYDALYRARNITTNNLPEGLTTIMDYATAAGMIVNNNSIVLDGTDEYWTSLTYENGINIEGTESLIDLLTAIAEMTYNIYYINSEDKLVFKRLQGEAILIDKSQYFELDAKSKRKLTSLTHATELGDNITAELAPIATIEEGEEGEETETEEEYNPDYAQYIRNNPFIELREDAAAIVNSLFAATSGMEIGQYEIDWRGNPCIEIGDTLEIITKDQGSIISYLINDVVEYSGGLSQTSSWICDGNTGDSEGNPTSLGESLKLTYAKVDKLNKKIELLVADNDSNKEIVSQLVIDTEGIKASVSGNETALEDISGSINELREEVSTKITPEAVEIAISSALTDGVNKVATSTGFTFDEEGLTISKSDSEMETLIDEDGMKVSKNDVEVLTANNIGVNAINLTAKQYLIIGGNSRFEDYGSNRTGCFWIGG